MSENEEKGVIEIVSRRISAERNLESWALWQPADSRSDPKARVLTREITHTDGGSLTARVELRFDPVLGALTTEDEKVLYALIRMWEEDQRPDTLRFSLRRLSRTLKRGWGRNERAALVNSLRRLRAVPMTWTNAYHDSAAGKTLRTLSEFTILNHLQIAEVEEDAHITTQRCEASFDRAVMTNLRAFYTKPVLFDVILGLKSGIAQLVYRYVDPMLVGRDKFTRRTAELFADLELDGPSYRKPSERKRALERAFRELNGVALSEGGVLRCSLHPAKSANEINAVFTKVKQLGPKPDPVVEEKASAATAEESHDDASNLVRDFHRQFFGIDNHTPRKRELAQAQKILEEHGPEAARYVIDFALAEATRTKFRVATFGAISQYIDRAVADFVGRSNQPAADEHAGCALCGGQNRFRARWPDGREDLVPCPHDAARLRAWVEEKGLDLIDGPAL
jgi:hypothetical protein